jgi:prepilin-type N-terminal cleavage/methylation domain-containing protein
MQNKGFTLIELLVVIAIIGILAGIIVVSMGGAQNSATNAKVKATMDQMRSAAELYKINTNAGDDYNGVAGDVDVDRLVDAVVEVIPTAPAAVVVQTGDAAWCYSVTLLTTPATYWCVDSAGYAGAPAASGTCTTTTGACR